jgi:4,5-DOPA dioxygenase extradiol
MLPSLFISHGAPTLPLDACPAREFLKGLSAEIDRPRAILAVSAHWDSDAPAVNNVAVNETIHDFYGFPEALYRIRYKAPGSAALAERTRALLNDAGFACGSDRSRGLDHGAWSPLSLIYPDPVIPVVQLSVQSGLGAAHHFALGRALAPLREEGVLVLGSGGFVHNLRTLTRWVVDAPEPQWSTDFGDWVHERLAQGRAEELLDYRRLAPNAALAHPTEEHFLPLFVAFGAGGKEAQGHRLHRNVMYGSQRMDAYAFT